MAYDSSRSVTVLFGGFTIFSYLGGALETYVNDVNEWNGTNWTDSIGSVPPARNQHATVYDSSRGVTVLFGGYWCVAAWADCGDTWEWDGTSWTQQEPAVSPPARHSHSMAYDSARGLTILFGGEGIGTGNFLSDTWEWNGTTWTQESPTTSPSARDSSAMAYDAARGVTVLFGGNAQGVAQNDTWEWNGTNWTQESPSTSPPARSGHAMVYDSIRGVTVLFGGLGSGSNELNDTWEWNGTTWTQVFSVIAPSARSGHAMAYDTVQGVTVLFGGSASSSGAPLNDTWIWDGSVWTQQSPTVVPPARYNHTMIFDSAHGSIVMLSGTGTSGTLDDLWMW
jgi:hypothetical protein